MSGVGLKNKDFMKKLITPILLLFIAITCGANSFKKVDARVLNYPKTISSADELASLINTDFETELEKSRAIFTWIALNIKYDIEEFEQSKSITPSDFLSESGKSKDEIIQNTLGKNKAVCSGYSGLFATLCKLCGIKCVNLSGVAKTTIADIGQYPETSNHSWNAIKIKRKWHLVDVTWAAGYFSNSNDYVSEFNPIWFMTPPERFYLKHYPEDRSKLLVKRSKKDFQKLPLFYSNFLDFDIEILEPETGIIEKVKQQQIKFTIKTTEDPNGFYYKLPNGKHITAMQLVNDGEYYSCVLPITAQTNGIISIYYNNQAIVKYKLHLKKWAKKH
jgi:transglutaminase/protease-like cytokinesis protein 3